VVSPLRFTLVIKLKNILLVIRDQLPFRRFIRNFFVTRNAWGLFHINSHVNQTTGKPKVQYNTKPTAVKSALAMEKKNGFHYSPYKCLFCDGYHIGRNRDNKVKLSEK
jgi:hypothetical protein